MSKGSSFLPFVFIVLVIGITLISWTIYNIYYGSSYQSLVFEESKLDTMRNEMEKIKGFSRQSLIYSSHQSLTEHAVASGMMTEAGPWICNGADPPSVADTVECLEKYTEYHVNAYLRNYSTEVPIELNIQNFSEAEFDVTESDVLSGAHDEGEMYVVLRDAKIGMSSREIEMSDLINIETEIDKNRFWYMYRIFTEWAETNMFGDGICSCASSCGDCACAENVAQESLFDLQNRFDMFVICDSQIKCCTNEHGDICGESGCEDWIQDVCFDPCGFECTDPNLIFEGPNVTNLTSYGEMPEDKLSLQAAGCHAYIPIENRLASVYTFRCIDYKYYVPTTSGPKELMFSVDAFGTFYDLDGCITEEPCTGFGCTPSSGCSSCTPPCPNYTCTA